MKKDAINDISRGFFLLFEWIGKALIDYEVNLEYSVYMIVEFKHPCRLIIRLNEREMFLTARASDSVVLLRKHGVIAT